MPSRLDAILSTAVEAIGGAPRAGQVAMADAVGRAFDRGEHLLVQAGTGTGKSLGYLAPALDHLARHPDSRVVVATATLALQAQLANADIPAAVAAAEAVTGQTISHAILKGRTNYACLHRVRDGHGVEQATLLGGEQLAESLRAASSDALSVLGAEVVSLREWAEREAGEGGVADRDDAPPHTPGAWAQVSVPTRECLGVGVCRFGHECFVERSREVARASRLVVTNHALVAIDALHGGTALPEHDLLIIDEAHELVARVTGAASHELSPQQVDRVAKRCLTWLDDDLGEEFLDCADALREALDAAPLARVEDPDGEIAAVLRLTREVARRAVSALATSDDPPERKQAAAAAREVFEVADQMAALKPRDVVWVSERERFGRWLVAAPLDVAGLIREQIFTVTPTVLTSATLKLGGQFEAVAAAVGLPRGERLPDQRDADEASAGPGEGRGPTAGEDERRPAGAGGQTTDVGVADAGSRPSHLKASDPGASDPDAANDTDTDDAATDADPEASEPEAQPLAWRALDVGSPFDYGRQGILYVARHLPPPRRDGITAEALAEVAELVWAADGRTLGLFASQRSAEAAARFCRAELPGHTVLCQGDAQLPELTRRFIEDPATSLFGTLSLWQGVDVPGDTCVLVIIDKIPFPRPDDPLMQARQRAVAEAGGNGFMQVAAAHAALLLAQGSGRLIRRLTDRGVVAVLDPRLRTARYGSFLRASMPDFWTTTDRETAIGALRRLSGQVGDAV